MHKHLPPTNGLIYWKCLRDFEISNISAVTSHAHAIMSYSNYTITPQTGHTAGYELHHRP